MILAVAGPREIGPLEFRVNLAIDEFFGALRQAEGRCRVVHGAARGVDLLCAAAAERHGHEVVPYPVTKSDARVARQRYGNDRKAPLVRTVRMLDDAVPDVLRAWWDGKSTGTGFTISAAKKRGIPTRVFRYDLAK